MKAPDSPGTPTLVAQLEALRAECARLIVRLGGSPGPWPAPRISPRAQQLVSRAGAILAPYRGAGRLFKSRDLAVALGLDDPTGRTTREITSALLDAGVAVASKNVVSAGGGLYVVSSTEELHDACRALVSRASEVLDRAARLVTAYERGPAQPALLDLPLVPSQLPAGQPGAP